MELAGRQIEYLDPKLHEEVKNELSKKIPQSYVLNLQILREYEKRGGKVKYHGPKTEPGDVKKRLKEEHENKVKRKSKSKGAISIDLIRGFLED